MESKITSLSGLSRLTHTFVKIWVGGMCCWLFVVPCLIYSYWLGFIGLRGMLQPGGWLLLLCSFTHLEVFVSTSFRLNTQKVIYGGGLGFSAYLCLMERQTTFSILDMLELAWLCTLSSMLLAGFGFQFIRSLSWYYKFSSWLPSDLTTPLTCLQLFSLPITCGWWANVTVT